MPGCEAVGSVQRAGALPAGKEGFVTGWGTKQGVPHCYWDNWLSSLEAAVALGAPLTHRPGRGQEKDAISHRTAVLVTW